MIAPAGLPLALEPRPVVPLPGQWTFWAETMIGNVPLGNVDAAGFYCMSRLSDFGYGNVTLNLPCGLEADRIRQFWSWRLWAFYDGEPYWCGVPTGAADQHASAHVQVTLTELPGYLLRRAWDVYPFGEYRQAEQTGIARDIAQPVEDVGVQIITEPGPGQLRDRKYEYLESGSRGQLLTNLAGVLQGPEFRAEYRMISGRPVCLLRIAYPRVGSDHAGLGLAIPGAALGYRAQWDSDQMRTHTFAVGDTPAEHEGEEPPPRPVAEVRRPQAGLPRLDRVDDWPGTVLLSTLEERAGTMAPRNAGPALDFTASPPEGFPPITQYGPGDTVTIRAVTPLLPAGLDFDGRLTAVEVNAGQGIATWSVVGQMPPPATRETMFRKLGRLDTTLAQVFRSGPMERH